MNKLIYRFLYNFFKSFTTYISQFIFILYIFLQWFIGQRFFTSAGSTDLHRFFSSFPLAYILYIPLNVSICKTKEQWNFPYSTFKICLSSIISVYIICFFSTLLTMLIPFTIIFFGNIEWGQFFCGYFGILLYTLCAISFSTFIFSLIDNKAIAFVCSAIILSICNSVHNIPLYLDIGNFISLLIKSISFAWNFDSFAKGILDIKQILYFILVSIFFIFSICFIIEKQKGNNSKTFIKSKKLFAFTFILLCIICSLINIKFDLSKSKRFSITKYTKNIIANISEPISISYIISPSLKNLYPQVKDISDYLEMYALNSNLISFKIINPTNKKIQNTLSEYGILGQPIRTNSLTSSTVTNVYSAIIIDYLGMTETIPFILTTETLELDLAQKINSLIEEKKKLVQIVCANTLSIEKDYSYIFPYLKSLGYAPFISTLPSSNSSNDSFTFFQNIPLIILGCENITKEDSKHIENFILKGGKVFIASQPFSVNIKNDWSITQNKNQLFFERMLFTFGIYFKQTLTCDSSNFKITLANNSTNNDSQSNTQTEYINYPLWPVLKPQNFLSNGMTSFWPCAIDIDNEVASIESLETHPLLKTSYSSWQMNKTNGEFITNPFSCPKTPKETETTNQFTIAATVSKKETPNEIDLIVFADQYAFSTPMISYSSNQTIDFRSLEFLGNSLLLLSNEKDLLTLKNKNTFNHSLYKISDTEMSKAIKKTFFISLIIPFILLTLLKIFFYYKRRKILK